MNQYPIVLISGWAMPAGAMESLAEALDAHHRRVSVIELPGLVEELAAYKKVHDWNSLLDYIDQQLFEKPVVLVGWSMGGMLATLYASRYPDRVAGVINLAANVCFVASNRWPDGIDPALFASFYEGMTKSAEKTLQQFIMLCTAGTKARKEQARELQALITNTDLQTDTLVNLLTLIKESDLRSAYADLVCPVTHFFGQQDALVPVSSAEAIRSQLPTHQVEVLDGGHCFFMENSDPVVHKIKQLSEPE